MLWWLRNNAHFHPGNCSKLLSSCLKRKQGWSGTVYVLMSCKYWMQLIYCFLQIPSRNIVTLLVSQYIWMAHALTQFRYLSVTFFRRLWSVMLLNLVCTDISPVLGLSLSCNATLSASLPKATQKLSCDNWFPMLEDPVGMHLRWHKNISWIRIKEFFEVLFYL